MTLDTRARRAAEGIHRAVEVMEMSTSTTEPRKVERFDRFRDRKERNRQVGALLVAAMLAIAAIVAVTKALERGDKVPATPSQNGRIVFTSNIDSAGWDLFTMRADGTGVERLTVLPDPRSPFSAPEWSADGTQIVFTSPSPSSRLGQVYRIDADGSGLTQLTHGIHIDADSASWSPDGSKIVLKRAASAQYAIWVMNADGSGLKRLTSELYDNSDPTFTPDGKHILYASKRGGSSAIWIMNADGSDQRRLTPAGLEAASPDVSPDGSHVVFGQGGDPSNPASIYTMGIDGSGITRLTTPEGSHHDGLPKYSPDGMQIVYLTDRSYAYLDGMDIYVMNADGTDQHRVTSNLTLGGWPDSPYFNAVYPDWGPRPVAG
jgi:Tol biopolymer transport system component